VQPRTPFHTSQLTHGHQNRVITRWYVQSTLLCLAIGNKWQATMITLLNLGGTILTLNIPIDYSII
jgi:hypothetical protein